MLNKIKLFYRMLPLATVFSAMAQTGPERTYQIPVKLPPLLSGNFAELRSNHFHGGIDFKTLGSIGHPIYSFDEGWVSRILISPTGYGNALYVTHHNGLTTVYAHLHKFAPEIQQYIKEYQYKTETCHLDAEIEKGKIPVKRGQEIAKSGNTGSSAGPHLHFEIRDGEYAIDPLPYFIDKIEDTTKPELRYVRFYPLEGVVNGGRNNVTAYPVRHPDGTTSVNKKITAWGKIGIGAKAYDKMDSTYHVYGVKNVRLYVDDTLHFSMQQNRYPLADTRYINSLIDYADWQARRTMVMKLFVDPGNKLDFYGHVIDRGEITINEERPYKLRLELQDLYGNKRVFEFTIIGKKQEIPERPIKEGAVRFPYNQDNHYETDNFAINIPEGMIYTDIDFEHSTKPAVKEKGYSDIHKVGSLDIPLHSYVDIYLGLTKDPIADKSKYYVVCTDWEKPRYIGGTFENGKVKAKIRTFGSYMVKADTIAPTLTAVNPAGWGPNGTIRYTMKDSQSGIKSWRAEIDGEFALFENYGESNTLTYRIDKDRVEKGKTHTIKMVLTDNRDNVSVDERTFFW